MSLCFNVLVFLCFYILMYNNKMPRKRKIDKYFAVAVGGLVLSGLFFFLSAALGLLAEDKNEFFSVLISQIIFGLGGGLFLLILLSKINYRHYKQYAFYLFLLALLISCLVFVPGIGIARGVARRWIDIFGLSFQPAELLKLSFVIYFAALLSAFRQQLQHWKYSILPILALLGICATLAFFQKDFGTLLIIGITALGMIFAAGIKFKHFLIILAGLLVSIVPLALYKAYVWQRIITFFRPSQDLLGAGYQIWHSLIAIGSGGLAGKGFGKSIQKFGFLPEAMGDSIFAVTAEEWGLIGALFLIGLFLFFMWRGFRIASRAQDMFGRLLALGIVILIVSQSFLNMASMLGLFPITGMPLIFVSQGGTALLFALAEVGIIFNISKYKKL